MIWSLFRGLARLIGIKSYRDTLVSRYTKFIDLTRSTMSFQEWRETTEFEMGKIKVDCLNLSIFPDGVWSIRIYHTTATELNIDGEKPNLTRLTIHSSNIRRVSNVRNMSLIDKLELTNNELTTFPFSELPTVMGRLVFDDSRLIEIDRLPEHSHIGLLSAVNCPLENLDLSLPFIVWTTDFSGTPFEEYGKYTHRSRYKSNVA